MKLSIIIVSWNTGDLLEKCLRSVQKDLAGSMAEVFVIDNNSSDNTVEMIKEKFPRVKVIANKYNTGFAKANNQGIKEATGDYILLLNPDTELFPDTISKSIEFMASHPDCGVMGPKMLYVDNKLQPSVRRFPTVWPIFLMLIKAPKIFKNIKSINNYLATDFDYTKEQVVDQVMGAYMITKMEVLNKTGLLDEKFFIWFEEVDFCLRVVKAGYKVFYNPEVKVIHHGGKSFAQQKTINKQKMFFQSAWKYFIKNGFIKPIIKP